MVTAQLAAHHRIGNLTGIDGLSDEFVQSLRVSSLPPNIDEIQVALDQPGLDGLAEILLSGHGIPCPQVLMSKAAVGVDISDLCAALVQVPGQFMLSVLERQPRECLHAVGVAEFGCPLEAPHRLLPASRALV